jgi:hypothetical protein
MQGMKWVSCASAVAAAVLLPASVANAACPAMTLEERQERATHIVDAHAESIAPGENGRARARFVVERYDKSAGPAQFDLDFSETISESLRIKAGQRWRLLGRFGEDGTFLSNVCAGSFLIEGDVPTPTASAGGRATTLARTSDGGGGVRSPVLSVRRTVLVTVPAATTSGAVFRLAGRPGSLAAQHLGGGRFRVALPVVRRRQRLVVETPRAFFAGVLAPRR